MVTLPLRARNVYVVFVCWRLQIGQDDTDGAIGDEFDIEEGEGHEHPVPADDDQPEGYEMSTMNENATGSSFQRPPPAEY
jgi:hypothetical protein